MAVSPGAAASRRQAPLFVNFRFLFWQKRNLSRTGLTTSMVRDILGGIEGCRPLLMPPSSPERTTPVVGARIQDGMRWPYTVKIAFEEGYDLKETSGSGPCWFPAAESYNGRPMPTSTMTIMSTSQTTLSRCKMIRMGTISSETSQAVHSYFDDVSLHHARGEEVDGALHGFDV